MTLEWQPDRRLATFEAHVPREFVRRVSRSPVRPRILNNEAPLISCAEWLTEQAFTGIATLGDALALDIGPDPLIQSRPVI
jgi:hypothetical protein